MDVKTCPHCGGSACLNSTYSRNAKAYYVYVKCDICGAQGKAYRTAEDPKESNWGNYDCLDAVNAWNMRTGEA